MYVEEELTNGLEISYAIKEERCCSVSGLLCLSACACVCICMIGQGHTQQRRRLGTAAPTRSTASCCLYDLRWSNIFSNPTRDSSSLQEERNREERNREKKQKRGFAFRVAGKKQQTAAVSKERFALYINSLIYEIAIHCDCIVRDDSLLNKMKEWMNGRGSWVPEWVWRE